MSSFSRDLYKTKLCILYQRGRCLRQSCSFAHGDAELRRYSSGTFNGRRDYRGGDLRERLQRRHSPRGKRFSPRRDSPRGRQGHSDRGRSHSRSPLRGRSSRSVSPLKADVHRREKKRLRVDAPESNLSDVSADPPDHATWAHENLEHVTKSLSPDPKFLLEEELHEVHAEMDSLTEHASQIEFLCEEHTKVIQEQEAKIIELDSKLHREHEDYRRFSSKLKKFVKLLQRNERAQEEVKKTQARLLKMAEDFSLADPVNKLPPSSLGEESDVNIVSDGEGGPVEASVQLRRLELARCYIKDDSDMEGNAIERSGERKQKAYSPPGKLRTLKLSRADLQENSAEVVENEACEEERLTALSNRAVERVVVSHSIDLPSNKARRWDMNLNLPSTGLAAHAEDDIMENDDSKQGSGGIFSAQAAIAENFPGKLKSMNGIKDSLTSRALAATNALSQYAEYEGDDEDVDVEVVDDNPDNDGVISKHQNLVGKGKALFPIT